jgi:hypothetical protein
MAAVRVSFSYESRLRLGQALPPPAGIIAIREKSQPQALTLLYD